MSLLELTLIHSAFNLADGNIAKQSRWRPNVVLVVMSVSIGTISQYTEAPRLTNAAQKVGCSTSISSSSRARGRPSAQLISLLPVRVSISSWNQYRRYSPHSPFHAVHRPEKSPPLLLGNGFFNGRREIGFQLAVKSEHEACPQCHADLSTRCHQTPCIEKHPLTIPT